MLGMPRVEFTLPMLIEEKQTTPEQLAWLGHPNLLVALEEWRTELNELMTKLHTDSRRKDRRNKESYDGLVQHCTSVYFLLQMIEVAIEECEWKPLFPSYRKPDHFTESMTVWAFDNAVENPSFGPAFVICVDAQKNRVLLKLDDSGDHGFWTDLRGCNLFTMEEFSYLCNHLDYAESLLNSCCELGLDAKIIHGMIRGGKEKFESYFLR